jgi:hypothetical protein
VPAVAADTRPLVLLRIPLRFWIVRAPVFEIEVVAVPPNASVVPEMFVVEALVSEVLPETVREVSVPTLVSDDAVTVALSVPPVRVPAAAVTVMSAEPLNDTPLMLRAVWRVVAVSALPPIERPEAVPVRPVPAPEKEFAVSDPTTSALPVVVAPPLIVRPPACVPLPIVDDALTKIPTVDVGARAPFWSSNVLPNGDEPAVA